MQSRCRYRCQCCSLCRRPFWHCNKLQRSLTRPPEASGMRHETRFSTGPSLVKMTTDRWKTRSSIHGYIHRSMHASAAQEPETRGGGQSPSGVFNPPPREVRTEQSVLNVNQKLLRSLKTILGPPVPAMFRRILRVPFCPFGPNFALRRPKTTSRSDVDGQLRPKVLQDRLKTPQDPLLTPTWAQLGLISTPS